ncbi:lysophosphatidic acid receptor 6-like [Sceloporus undulatus]|uniref:lysophosphatidic acid receptor 6-like n=1 Tax=Sceloporus undulatus TaxID=8520 RepID=UPI001C4B2F22|nr:lysophosphatidic acid receptor 6-like [Sceloporus undulatus]
MQCLTCSRKGRKGFIKKNLLLILYILPKNTLAVSMENSFGKYEWMETSTSQANCSQANPSQQYQPILPSVELFQIIIYIPTFILGVLFNGMAIWFAFHKIRRLTESVIYMVTLMILDIFVLFALPFKIISYDKRKWDLGHVFCSFLESLYFVNMYGSIFISLGICVDRYLAILHPFVAVSLRSPRKAAITCVIISAGVWAGTACTYQLHKDDSPKFCFHGFSEDIWKNIILLVTLETVFLASTIAMILCTVQIILCLQKSRKPDSPPTIKSKSVKILVVNLTTFLVCFAPFHVALVLYYLVKNCILSDGQEAIRTFLQITLCWANLNCFLDGICFYFVFKESLKPVSNESNAINVD